MAAKIFGVPDRSISSGRGAPTPKKPAPPVKGKAPMPKGVPPRIRQLP